MLSRKFYEGNYELVDDKLPQDTWPLIVREYYNESN